MGSGVGSRLGVSDGDADGDGHTIGDADGSTEASGSTEAHGSMDGLSDGRAHPAPLPISGPHDFP